MRAENSCGVTPYTNLPVIPFACGDVITDVRDAQTYTTVLIGTQCWFAENLNIGTRINTSIPQSQQSPEIIEKYCYNNIEDSCSIYGGLYQWNEMMQYTMTESTQGICPGGWHIPSDAEWCILENYADSDTVDCQVLEWRGTDAGIKLKETGTMHWISPNNATNSTGFTALGGGRTYEDGSYEGRVSGWFWTSTGSWNASIRMLASYSDQSYGYPYFHFTNGFSVRCLKDQ